jgi:predicted nucleic acid-binding protein
MSLRLARMLVAAVGLQQKARISFWDALVVQAAIDAGCDRLYSEDLNHGQRFGPVEVVNPFRASSPSRKCRPQTVQARATGRTC